jgi:hypothetical protein
MAKKKNPAEAVNPVEQAAAQRKREQAKPTEPGGVTKFQKFKSITIDRKEIRNAQYNPRQMSPSAKRRLRTSLENPKIGLVNALIWNRRTGNLVGGHQRIEQLDVLEGHQDYKLTVDMIDVDEVVEKEINVLLNNPAVQGQYDLDMLQDIIGSIAQTEGGDIHATGFATSDLHALFDDDFLSGVFAEQRDDEKPHIDVLEEMRQAGRDEEKAAAAGDDGTGASGPQPQSDLFGDPPPAPAGQDGTTQSTITGSTTTTTFKAKPDPETDPEAYAEYKRQMHEQRQAYIDAKSSDEDEADVMITIVFEGHDDIVKALDHLGLDLTKRYFDASEFFAAANVTV